MLIPRKTPPTTVGEVKGALKAPPEDEPASHQLVGEVKAYQGEDG